MRGPRPRALARGGIGREDRLHNIEQRLTRWLLITQDRVESPTFAITHDFLATMLGTDRPTLSSAAGILREKHAIEYTRGVVQILSRAKLENRTCECYGALNRSAVAVDLWALGGL